MIQGNRFTDKFIMNLKPKEKEYWIREGQGFALRVLPSGEKAWYYIYTLDGRKRFMKLKDGGYPDVSLADAREAFDIAKVKVKNGSDPLTEKKSEKEERRKAHTVEDLVKDYIDKHAKVHKRSWQEDERILNKEVVPLWGKDKAVDIKKRDVVLLLEKIMERGSPGMSNNTFQVVRKMFNFAVERDILPYSPATGVKALAPKVMRERALSADEIKILWDGLENAFISNDCKRALKLILVTAQRPGEVIGMHRSEIDDRWWTIPMDRAKNGKTHRVYLTDMALTLIDGLTFIDPDTGEIKDKGFIFPCPHKTKKKSIDPHALAIAVHRNLMWPLMDKNGKPLFDADGKPAIENKLGVEQFTPHDLRCTAATFLAQMGTMDEVIDAVLNHAKQGIIKVYNQYRYDKEKQMALEAWEWKLNSIIAGTKSNVVAINSRKKNQQIKS
jgi:integrase